jgi:hypothetical protein
MEFNSAFKGLKKTFNKNVYSRCDFKQVFSTTKKWPQNERVTSVAMSPYKHSASKKHYNVACYTIKFVHTHSKNIHALRPMKENLVLNTP